MPEAVIVDAVRTPIGRAFKGSLAALRPDDMGAYVRRPAARAQPRGGARRDRGGDLRLRPAPGRAGLQHRPHHRAAVGGCPTRVTGATVSATARRASRRSGIAANAVMAGEGDTYIAAGVEWVASRYNGRRSEAAPAQAPDQNEQPAGQERPTATTPTSRWALTAENVADKYEVKPRGHGQVRPALTGAGREVRRTTASSTARSWRSSCPTAAAWRRTTARAPDSTLEKLASLKPAFREDGKVTAGNSCPLNDGAAAVLVMSDTQREGARPEAARARSSPRPPAASSRRSWAWPRSARSRTCSPAPA